MPRVSVITPCYNAASFVAQTVESVRRQTFTDWEHVVVDDGSTDRSAEIVAALADDAEGVRLVQRPNGGTARARNIGFRACSEQSDYLLFLDADDYLRPRMLEVLVGHLDAHPAVGMAFCKYTEVNEEGRPLPPREHLQVRYAPARFDICELPPEHLETPPLTVLTTSTTVPIPSQSLIRRSVYEQTPGFDEVMGQGCEDADLFLHLALRSPLHYLPQELICYRQHPGQYTVRRQGHEDPQRRFARKWKRPEGLTREQERTLRKAWRYWRGRIIPRIWWKAGKGALREGRWGKAALLCGGAFARYLCSPLSMGWGLTQRTYPRPLEEAEPVKPAGAVEEGRPEEMNSAGNLRNNGVAA